MLNLPNGKNAYVDLAKLENYCLDCHHPRGKHKARVFASHGITSPDLLRLVLLEAASRDLALEGEKDQYGIRYTMDFDCDTARIRSIWIIRINEDFPRLVTCYIL
jgi:hypothetical protein